MENVQELVRDIKVSKTQNSSSQKDEVKVMKAMINDRDYKVVTYSSKGPSGEVCPSEEIRTFTSSVISKAANIPSSEAQKLADAHEFNKAEANKLVNVSKEFVNTYLDTGRKLPFGGRERSNVSIIQAEVPEKKTTYPKKVGVDAEGKDKFEFPVVTVPAHKSIKSSGACPKWLKK